MAEYELAANLSILFTEVPLRERPLRARDAGFRLVEMWWPFSGATPSDAEVDDLLGAVGSAGVSLAGLNLFAGDMPAGERGILSDPERVAEFRDSIAVTAAIAERTGCRLFNALYGARRPTSSVEQQDATALDNLAFAAEALAPTDGTLLIEPLCRVADFPLLTADDGAATVAAARERIGSDRVALLFDTFHLTNNGDDLLADISTHADIIRHVQYADAPDRGQPGTGSVDFAAVTNALSDAGYAGVIAAEYSPTVPTAESFGWIDGLEGVHLAAR